MRQQMVDMYKQVGDSTAFVRGDGSRLHSLKALEMALYTMTDGEFNHHVANGRNDFANWVLHVFNQKDLSYRLSASKSRVDMLAVLDEASRESTSAKSSSFIGALQSKAATQAKTPVVQPVQAVVSNSSNKTSGTVAKTTGAVVKSGKSFHHKLKGMFRKGEAPVTHQNAHAYQSALASAKEIGHSGHVHESASHTLGVNRHTIHAQIEHLDAQLAHLTRHHKHTEARDDVGSALLEESVKERILDFSLGLIVGLMLGFILAKSLGL